MNEMLLLVLMGAATGVVAYLLFHSIADFHPPFNEYSLLNDTVPYEEWDAQHDDDHIIFDQERRQK